MLPFIKNKIKRKDHRICVSQSNREHYSVVIKSNFQICNKDVISKDNYLNQFSRIYC